MTAFDPLSGARLAPAWKAAVELLNDGTWHTWTSTVTTMVEHSDLKAVSCSNLLHDAAKAGWLQRRGQHPQREVCMPAAPPAPPTREPASSEEGTP